MSASLIELILSMALAGLVFAGALIPVTQTVVAYQEAEADMQSLTAQHLAAQRCAQVVATLWRGEDAPPGCAPLAQTQRDELSVGDWTLRARRDALEQAFRGRAADRLAAPAENFALTYRVAGGAWKSSLEADEWNDLVAVRYAWNDATRTYRGMVTPADRRFEPTTVVLPAPDDSGVPYRRADYERHIELKVEAWP